MADAVPSAGRKRTQDSSGSRYDQKRRGRGPGAIPCQAVAALLRAPLWLVPNQALERLLYLRRSNSVLSM